jgi:hypothetical protein
MRTQIERSAANEGHTGCFSGIFRPGPQFTSVVFGSVFAALLLFRCPSQAATNAFPECSTLPQQSTLPDPLLMLDGRKVTSRAQWLNERRPELLALFEHYMYGPIPPKPAHQQTKVLGEYRDFLGGEATLKLVILETGPVPAPRIDLMLVVPNRSSAPQGSDRRQPSPAPVFLAMDFCGNHALTADPRVPLARSWLGNSCAGCRNNAATEAARGSQATNWPLEEIVRRGYALATFYSGDVDSDRAEASVGVYAWLAAGDPARNNPTNRGTIDAWPGVSSAASTIW